MEEIDKILFDISSKENPKILDEDDFDNWPLYVGYRSNIDLMINDYRIIRKPFNNSLDVVLTQLGSEVVSQGGWTKYLENEKYKEKIKSDAELENLQTSTRVNKFLLKTKWAPLFLSLAAIFVSIYFSVQDKNKQEELETKTLENEKTIDSLKIQISNLHKKTVLIK